MSVSPLPLLPFIHKERYMDKKGKREKSESVSQSGVEENCEKRFCTVLQQYGTVFFDLQPKKVRLLFVFA